MSRIRHQALQDYFNSILSSKTGRDPLCHISLWSCHSPLNVLEYPSQKLGSRTNVPFYLTTHDRYARGEVGQAKIQRNHWQLGQGPFTRNRIFTIAGLDIDYSLKVDHHHKELPKEAGPHLPDVVLRF